MPPRCRDPSLRKIEQFASRKPSFQETMEKIHDQPNMPAVIRYRRPEADEVFKVAATIDQPLKVAVVVETSKVVSFSMLVRVCISCKRIELQIQISFEQYS